MGAFVRRFLVGSGAFFGSAPVLFSITGFSFGLPSFLDGEWSC